MILYSPHLTPRLRYVADFLAAYYGRAVALTESVEEFASATGPRINYSLQPITEDEIRIEPAGLLFDRGVRDQHLTCFDHPSGYKAFYRARGPLGFDLLAAVFYLLTRYEEYLPHPKDAYGRYDHRNSLAFREGFLHQPLIHTWLNDFAHRLGLSASEHPLREDVSPSPQNPLNPAHSPFRLTPTYDIDIAWSFRHKEGWRSAGGVVRALVQGRFDEVHLRHRVRRGEAPDPFDAYGFLDTLHTHYQLQPRYFFHVGLRRGRYDKNISPHHPALQQLVCEVAARYPIGLHPSWYSGDHPEFLEKEKALLEEIVGAPVTHSRQHYIRLALPATYRRLLAAGISDDYSMGYGSTNGFRASVAVPFYWYDLERDEQTPLRLHPFAFMDANSFFEQKQDAGQSLKELLHYYQTVRTAGGELTTIFHNNFLGSDPLYRGWPEAYRRFWERVRSDKQA